MSYRAGFVGLIGQPNAGKSTLMNHLVKDKVSIVTPKPQTTRRRMLGIVSRENEQFIFVDAPGIVHSTSGLNEYLKKEALDVIMSSDCLIGVVSLDEKEKEKVEEILALLAQSKKPYVVVINKVDLNQNRHRLDIIKDLVRKVSLEIPIIEFSSNWGSEIPGVLTQLMNQLAGFLPLSQKPLYDVELYTPHSTRDLVAEIIREKCFEALAQEIPYSLAVRITSFEEEVRPGKVTKIQADLILARDGQQKIVVGSSGQQIKEIGMSARKDIEKLMGQKIYLGLQAVVRPEWYKNKRQMSDLGYTIDNQ